MSEWIEMGRFKELDEAAQKEANRLAEYALDVALDPARSFVLRKQRMDFVC